MKLVLEGRSYNEIVEAVGCSRRDVSVVKKTVIARGITAGLAESMTDADVQALFPDGRKRVSDEYESPDYAAVLRSMKANRHFTLQQARRKYVGVAGQGKKYGYSQYCHLFGEHLRVNDLIATLQHEPGRAMLVDWAGDTINLVDAVTGEVARAFLFVAVLPFSGAVFTHAYTNMKSEAWLDAHVRAFSYFGGVTQIIVPDKPTTSTHRRTHGDAERVVNARYQQFADHYGTAIVPARVKKPRDYPEDLVIPSFPRWCRWVPSRAVIPRDNYFSPASCRSRSSSPFQIEAGSGVLLAAFWIASRTIWLSAEA